MNQTDLVTRLFEIIGDTSETLVYLKKFQSTLNGLFTMIVIDYESISKMGESILLDLKLLNGLGLFPLICIQKESYDCINSNFNYLANFKTEFIDQKINFHVVDINSKIDQILCLIADKKNPILVYESDFGEVDLDSKSILSMINELSLTKLVFLKANKLFLDNSNNPINLINFRKWKSDNSIQFTESENRLIFTFKQFLKKDLSSVMSISVTTPFSLMKELFTIKGSGTLFRNGNEIFLYDQNQILPEKIKTLLESSFHKKLKAEFLSNGFEKIILESEYRGAAILKATDFGIMLSKFAVDEIARGEGIGREIWDEMKLHYKSFFWRAKKHNRINKWYIKESDGFFKLKNWNMFWINIDPSLIKPISVFLDNSPEDFYE
jgi:acetylglutamate synthase